ncbi:hypothetical protein [Paraburkholderia sediminicola]|uniref:hypothetical protein n=1 Tax=Paraburkholderia sediminicola TaxID=458836 RepID=UPI0038BDA59E
MQKGFGFVWINLLLSFYGGPSLRHELNEKPLNLKGSAAFLFLHSTTQLLAGRASARRMPVLQKSSLVFLGDRVNPFVRVDKRESGSGSNPAEDHASKRTSFPRGDFENTSWDRSTKLRQRSPESLPVFARDMRPHTYPDFNPTLK